MIIPLHDEPRPLDADLAARHDRTIRVRGIGSGGQARLAAARVLVVGAGGLGTPVLTYLAGAGVGRLGISDADVVEASNLQRQVIHDEAAVGRPKTASAARRVRLINAAVDVREHGPATVALLDEVGPGYDLIMDCTDTFDAKYLVADWCAAAGVPLVWGTIVGTAWQAACFWSRPAEGHPTTLRDLHAAPPAPGATPSAREVGVLGPAVGVCGSQLAVEAIKLITGLGRPLLGRVAVGDVAVPRLDVLTFGGAA